VAALAPWPDAPAPREEPEHFGDRVRERRLRRGWSQATLAAAAGLHPDSVTKLERGLHAAKPGTAAALETALARPAALLPAAVGRRMPGRPPSAATAGAFGALLAGYRRRAGLSQYALGAEAGLNASAINRHESGDRARPKRETVDALARALGLTGRECDLLLVAAGYAPSWAGDRTVRQLAAILDADEAAAQTVRAMVTAAYRVAAGVPAGAARGAGR